MIDRECAEKVKGYAKQYPVIFITGPRQSGKTTLASFLFENMPYVSLENLDERGFARSDPRGFLARFPDGAVLDEIQRTPDLLSYIQTITDKTEREGMFILTGSQQFEIFDMISQSLAGRTALVKLLPFSLAEAYGSELKSISKEEVIYRGFYPRIFDKQLNPTEAMTFYIATYVERDVRNILNVKDLSRFELFLKLSAGRIGQVLNLSSLGNDCGVNHNTIKQWLSVLEASYIIKLLHPYYRNFGKRLIKSPKLYFTDTGLACCLLGITNAEQIPTHYLAGALFENLMVAEILKHRFNKGKTDNLYYFRDNTGHEIDLISDNGTDIDLIEMKYGQTVSGDYFKNILFLKKHAGNFIKNAYVIYGGEDSYIRNDVHVLSWKKGINES